jgi:hypothetical protein
MSQKTMSKPEAVKKAKEIFLARKNDAEFPEDDWKAISPEWDINLYTEGGQPHVALHAVSANGQTEPFGDTIE